MTAIHDITEVVDGLEDQIQELTETVKMLTKTHEIKDQVIAKQDELIKVLKEKENEDKTNNGRLH